MSEKQKTISKQDERSIRSAIAKIHIHYPKYFEAQRKLHERLLKYFEDDDLTFCDEMIDSLLGGGGTTNQSYGFEEMISDLNATRDLSAGFGKKLKPILIQSERKKHDT